MHGLLQSYSTYGEIRSLSITSAEHNAVMVLELTAVLGTQNYAQLSIGKGRLHDSIPLNSSNGLLLVILGVTLS